MKKIISLAVVSLLSMTGICQKIRIGPEIGFNAITIENTDLSKDFQPGWHGGIAFEYDFFESFAIKIGIYYSQKRQQYTDSDTSSILDALGGLGGFGGGGTDGIDLGEISGLDIPGIDLNSYTNYTGRQSQHYFELPIMAEYKFKGLRVYGGGYMGFMFAARSKVQEITNTPATQTIDISSLDSTGLLSFFLPAPYSESYSENSNTTNLRVFDYGVKAGVGYETNNIGFHLAYQYGIPDYRIDREGSSLQNHQYFQFSINYMFPLGKPEMGASRL